MATVAQDVKLMELPSKRTDKEPVDKKTTAAKLCQLIWKYEMDMGSVTCAQFQCVPDAGNGVMQAPTSLHKS